MFLLCGSGTILTQYSHGKAENELEELQLTKSDKSKQKPSRTKAPNQETKRREQAKRIYVEENQSLDVVKSFAESISANFTVLTESMTNSSQKLGENLNVMNDNIMSLVHWPESEVSEDISEQLNVNEVNEASEKHSNDEQNADESATGQAEPPSKRKKDSLCCLEAANWELVQRRREALKPQISKDYAHYICVLKKSNLLILCLETMLPNKSKILQMIIKSLISCWTKIDRGTDSPMQTGALVGVVQVLEAHPFEDEVQPTVLF